MANRLITFHHRGNFARTYNFLRKASRKEFYSKIEKYAQMGVDALASATPVDTGKTAESWGYEIVRKPNSITIYWTNSNKNDGVPIAVIIQYGHGTGTGGYVVPNDYINPSIKPIFQEIADSVWKEVTAS